jgi:hypothetical protein
VAKRESLIAGQKNVVNTPVINPEKCLPPLHVRLGLIKGTIKTVDQNSAGFKFSGISDARIKEGVSVGPQKT